MEVIKGRMYDYNNGRFLSVDPFIQAPTSTQSMNPYTYIFNNPLSGVDPTGYLSHGLGDRISGDLGPVGYGSDCPFCVSTDGGKEGDGEKKKGGGDSSTINNQSGITKNGVCCDFGVISESLQENAKNMGVGEFLSKGFGEIANNPEHIEGAVSVAGQIITNATGLNGEAIVNVTGAGDIVQSIVTGGNQAAAGNLKAAATTLLVTVVTSKAKIIEKFGELKFVGSGSGPSGSVTGAIGTVRNKPGSLGKFKGTDALRRENKMARDAAKGAKLTKDQQKKLHTEISGQELSYQEIQEIAELIYDGKY